MKRLLHFLQWLTLLSGLGCFVVGLALLQPTPTLAQNSDAKYVGSDDCSDCHKDTARTHKDTAHALALFQPARQAASIIGDFTAADPLLTFQFPNETAARPVTLDDIKFVIGAGVHAQAYVIEIEKRHYAVLPFEWNVTEKKWQALTLAPTWTAEGYDFTSQCAGCHVSGLDAEALANGEGKWEDAGVQCEACHGPASNHLDVVDKTGRNPNAEELKTIRASIYAVPDAQMCGQCHSRGTDPTQNLPYPITYRPGMNLLDAGVFALAPTSDTIHWWGDGHAKMTNMQFNEWLTTGHGNALDTLKNSPNADESCLTCHSADAITAAEGTAVTLADAQFGVTCVACHDVHAKEPAPQLLRDKPDALCQSCHSNTTLETIHHPTTEMVTGQSLIASIPGITTKHATVENGPTCTSCHMVDMSMGTEVRASHTFTPVLPGNAEVGEPDTCTVCHEDLSQTYGQHFINKQQHNTAQRLLLIDSKLETVAAPQWVLDAVSIVKGDGSYGVHNVPYTEDLLNRIEVELGLTLPLTQSSTTISTANPQDCAECHKEQYAEWANSLHANTLLQESFKKAFADSGQPTYCLRCHASGYEPLTQQYSYDGVICTSCHQIEAGVEHPPAPISLANDPQICGQCHSGGHASAYEEWLSSAHAPAGVDCIDCHTAHNNGLVLVDVNATCSNCHKEAMGDEIHMGQDMQCTDCHMTPRDSAPDPNKRTKSGHMMMIDPGVCADCHGNTHMLSKVGDQVVSVSEELTQQQAVITQLQSKAEDNLSNGLIGGAVGVLLLLGLIYLILRLGRMR